MKIEPDHYSFKIKKSLLSSKRMKELNILKSKYKINMGDIVAACILLVLKLPAVRNKAIEIARERKRK